MSYTWPDLLTALIEGKDLDPDQTRWAMDQVLSGEATDVQVAGFAVALRAKGETVAELTGLAAAMLSHATKISLSEDAVDIVGTGGDRANTVNISTMAAIVAAANGARVVKHGNRAASSACGAADVLEALGVALNVSAQLQPQILAECGIVFLFAPLYHPSFRYAVTARRELGVKTTFNFLGPLTNPAKPIAQAIGVADRKMAPLVAGVLAARGARGLVFHGGDGLDELTTTQPSDIWIVGDGLVSATQLDPLDLGIARSQKTDLQGGSPAHNAEVVREVLTGKTGAIRDIVLLNAAAASLSYAGTAHGIALSEQLAPHLDAAQRAVDTGTAAELLRKWTAKTQAAAQS